jgi:UDP-glucose 4-epimerase
MTDLAAFLIGDRDISTVFTGIRPGEKIHEILVSEEEAQRTFKRDDLNLVILPLLPELRSEQVEAEPFGDREYSSGKDPLDREAVTELLRENRLMVDDAPVFAA